MVLETEPQSGPGRGPGPGLLLGWFLVPGSWCLVPGLTSSVVQVSAGSRCRHFVSYRRGDFVQMRFPKFSLPKVRTPDSDPRL